MIRKLRQKIILVTLISVMLVLSVIVIGLNVSNYLRIRDEADQTLNYLAENGGQFPSMQQPRKPADMSPELPFESRYFVVRMDSEGTITSLDLQNISAISEDQAVTYAEAAVSGNSERGYQDSYRYYVVKSETETMILFLDNSRDLGSFRAFMMNSAALSLMGMVAVWLLALFFSRLLVRPIIIALEKQKRFVTDASHELKTPLSIISANAEVMEISFGKNEWLTSTKQQIKRLKALISGMLLLARMDEAEENNAMHDLRINDILHNINDEFASRFQRQKLTLDYQGSDAVVNGNEELLYQLFRILYDNALHYAKSNTVIRVCVSELKDHHLEFEIHNEVAQIESGDLDRVFDRFKRLDDSRSRATGGSGIGLSIAASIVEHHRGSIHAFSQDGKSFTLTLRI